MPTAFDQVIQDLNAAAGDFGKLALITFDFIVRDDPALKAAAEAAAVPHWFDEATLAALLPQRAAEAAAVLQALQRLPMVETYPMEDRSPAWNLHEATRTALRRRLWLADLPRFLELSQRAADHFGTLAGPLEKTKEGVEKNAPWRIEAFCHRLLAQPAKGAEHVSVFVETLLATHRLERLQAVAALLAEVLEGPWDACAQAQRTRDAAEWARAQYNVGLALYHLGTCVAPQLGNRLLAQGVRAFRAALEVYARGSLPQQWADTQNTLAIALRNQGSRSEGAAGLALLGEAVAACRAALEVRTRESLPQDWAMTQNNLAIALQEQGTRSEGAAGLALLGEAVAAYRAALEVRTRESLPQKWAMTQYNLGIALGCQGDKAGDRDEKRRLYQQAEAACLLALEVHTPEALPYHHQLTQQILTLVRARLKALDEAQA